MENLLSSRQQAHFTLVQSFFCFLLHIIDGTLLGDDVAAQGTSVEDQTFVSAFVFDSLGSCSISAVLVQSRLKCMEVGVLGRKSEVRGRD